MTSNGISNWLILSILFGVSSLAAAEWHALYTSGLEKLGRRSLAEARGDLKAALEAAVAGKIDNAKRAEILHALGNVEFEMGRLRPSIAYREKALELFPPAARIAERFNIAQAYRELGETRKAEKYAREALASSPDDPRILQLLGSILILRRRFADAELVERRALGKGDPAVTPTVWTDLATIEESRGRYAPAAEMFRRAIDAMAASHARARALSNLATLERRLKRYREAVIHGRQAVTEMEKYAGPRHPDLFTVLDRHADALRHSGHLEEAEQTAERAKHLQAVLGATVDWRSVNR